MKRIFLFFFFFSLVCYVNAISDSVFIKANRLYDESRYEEAITVYESIIDSGYEAHALYYNLANAYYKMQNLGKSIVNYERAVKLKPGDEDTKYNLEMARALIVDKVNEIPPVFYTVWFSQLTQFIPIPAWSQLSLAAFALCLLLFLLYFFARRIAMKKIGFWFGILFFLVSAASYAIASKSAKVLAAQNQAIIIEASTTTKSSPDESGTNLFPIHEGTKVEIRNRVGDWVEIKLADGNKGWLKEYMVEVI
jgi:tetratricopeptide (TPR) repeat protein